MHRPNLFRAAASLIVVAGCSSSSSSTTPASDDSGVDSGVDSSSMQDSSTTAPEAGVDAMTTPDAQSATDAGGDSGAIADAAPDSFTGLFDAADPCSMAPTGAFYVNGATGSDSNSGAGPDCAMKTITAALTASSSAAHDNATIHVAAGTYGAGETFPLVVNHGRSLEGAGASTTTIQGSSASYNTSGTGSFLDTGTHYLTLLVGDVIGGSASLAATTVSGLKVLPATTVTAPTANYLGIVCLAGNAPTTGASLPLPSASLVLHALQVGPNFDTAAAIGSQPTQMTACNALVTASDFTGSNVGLETGTCGTTNPVGSWPSAQVGDGVGSDQNSFSASGIDLFGAGCGSIQSVNVNNFNSGYRGIVLVSQAAQYFEILGNTFNGASSSMPMGMGVQTNASAVIAKLDGNTFVNISESAAADTAMGGTTGYAVSVGTVLQAHANLIHDNDNGVSVGVVPASTFDFSSDGTAGNANQIYCNSKATGATGVGFDLVLAFTGTTPLDFAGNTWDHAAPTTSVSLTGSANGTDVVTGTSGGATLTGATATSVATCAQGRVH